MRVRIIEIKLRPNGNKVRLEREATVESFFIGRGPDNDLTLKGLTIPLHQATIRRSEGRLYVEAAAGQEVDLNGTVSTGDRLQPGDKLSVGQWEIRVLPPEEGFDLAFEYEEVGRPESERAQLDARTRIGVEVGMLARRPLSWALMGLVLFLFLVMPFAYGPWQTPWSSGPLARNHAYIESDCYACHQGLFKRVQNENCLGCHYDIRHHSGEDVLLTELDDRRCATCHLEHRGEIASLVDLGSGLCSDCHADLKSRVPETVLADASDFYTNHPQFRVQLVTDPEREAEEIELGGELVETSGVMFNHLLHVGQGVTGGEGGSKALVKCGDCHQLDSGGLYMKPINFEAHCQDCHTLNFDSQIKGQAVHGPPERVRESLTDAYNRVALSEAAYQDKADRNLLNLRRFRARGGNLTRDEVQATTEWVQGKVEQAEMKLYDRPGECQRCHGVTKDPARGGQTVGALPEMGAVQIQDVWVPGSTFSHISHAPFACKRCHPATAVFDPQEDSDIERPAWAVAGAKPYGLTSPSEYKGEGTLARSDVSMDVNIPGVDVCRECHGGVNAGGKLLPSQCSMCHPFHVPGNPLMAVPKTPKAGDEEAQTQAFRVESHPSRGGRLPPSHPALRSKNPVSVMSPHPIPFTGNGQDTGRDARDAEVEADDLHEPFAGHPPIADGRDLLAFARAAGAGRSASGMHGEPSRAPHTVSSLSQISSSGDPR